MKQGISPAVAIAVIVVVVILVCVVGFFVMSKKGSTVDPDEVDEKAMMQESMQGMPGAQGGPSSMPPPPSQ